jgi:transposase, IS30 family
MGAHLTLRDREYLQRLVKAKKSKSEIAALMNRHRSTIYRELERNSDAWGYRANRADFLAKRRRRSCHRPAKLRDIEMRLYVNDRLRVAWSPEQIAGRMRVEFPNRPAWRITAQTIYTWIKRCFGRPGRWLRLANRQVKNCQKGDDYVSIRGRPAVINRRRRYGDWEGDTIQGKRRHSGLVTLVERKSGLLRISKINNLRSATTMSAAERCLADLPPALRRSVTFDNGSEFTEHRKLTENLGVAVYFAEPYRAWQRGANENANGLLRQFFPKGTDFKRINPRDVKRVENLLNERPRRRLGYRTPIEILAGRLCRN